jgi:flagellar assembly protein FliH
MAATAKFTFNEDFSGGGKPTISVVEAERRRADAEAQAHRKGFAAGHAQAQSEAAQRSADALATISGSMARLEGVLSGIEQRLEIEAVKVAVAVASKLAPELIAREPLAELSALATECLHQLVSTPHLAVHIADDIFAPTKERLDDIARSRGFEGRLTVQADPEMTAGDCRIEWADGGVKRDLAATQSAIDELVGRYTAARASGTH